MGNRDDLIFGKQNEPKGNVKSFMKKERQSMKPQRSQRKPKIKGSRQNEKKINR
jgi:hypothetical protein